jgi:Domain of unknown function (DUF3291)
VADVQLAEANFARPLHPLTDDRMAAFVEAIARVNMLADEAPGFVWRLASARGHIEGVDLLGLPGTILNLSVWTDYESLHLFTYRGLHGRYLTDRDRWFEPIPGPTTALWWVPAGHQPTPKEAASRLQHLRTWGPTPRAFTVLRRFTATGATIRTRRRGAT